MLMTGLILMGMIMQSLAMGYVLPAAQCDLELTLKQRGWLSAIPFLAIILTSYFWGWLADTKGRRPAMLYSMLFSVVFTIFASFAPDLISFAILVFLSAVFTSGSSAVAYTYLGEFNNLRHRDKMVTFGSSFIGLGISWAILPLEFAYPVPVLGILYRPWRLLVVAIAVPFAVAMVLLYLAPESPKFLSVMAVLSSMKEQTLPLFKMPFIPWLSLTCFVQFGILAATNGFYVWFPTILNSLANHEGGETKICDVLDASRVSVANSTVIMLIVVLAVTGLCGIGAHLAYNQQLAVVLFAIFQMSGACIGLMNAVAVEIFPTKFRAMAICLSMMMGRVGSMVGSNLIGVFLQVNCGAGFYLFGGIIVES
ncbi:SV2-like protein 1, partial [Operophtera brumata]